MYPATAYDVDLAAERLARVFEPSPLRPSPRLSSEHGLDVWLKREDLQPVRSYN